MRTIDADALLKEINERYKIYSSEENPASTYVAATLSYVADEIIDAKTIEPQRIRGYWIDADDYYDRIRGRCSVCGWESHMYEDDVVGMNYCPNCGADMREE